MGRGDLYGDAFVAAMHTFEHDVVGIAAVHVASTLAALKFLQISFFLYLMTYATLQAMQTQE